MTHHAYLLHRSNIHDLSWGNRPAASGAGGSGSATDAASTRAREVKERLKQADKKETDEWNLEARSLLVLCWISWNLAIVATVIQTVPSLRFLEALGIFTAVFNGIRVSGALAFLGSRFLLAAQTRSLAPQG